MVQSWSTNRSRAQLDTLLGATRVAYFLAVTGYFHGGNTGSNPVGDAKFFQQVTVSPGPFFRHKKGTIRVANANSLRSRAGVFAGIMPLEVGTN